MNEPATTGSDCAGRPGDSKTEPATGRLPFPDWMEEVFTKYITADLSTVSKRGAPSIAPVAVFYDPDSQLFEVCTSVAYPQKAFNIKRDPNATILYSFPVGSGIAEPAPIVMVQGLGTVDDDLAKNRNRMEVIAEKLVATQPSFAKVWRSGFWRWWYKYYLLRLIINIKATRVLGWQDGDLSCEPLVLESPKGAAA